MIAIKLATCEESVNDYMRRTLLYHSVDSEELGVTISSTLDDLSKSGLVKIIDGSTYAATTLGEAVVASSLTPEDGLFVHRELLKALQGFAMDSDLHALYTFTPVQTTQSNVNVRILLPTFLLVLNELACSPQINKTSDWLASTNNWLLFGYFKANVII